MIGWSKPGLARGAAASPLLCPDKKGLHMVLEQARHEREIVGPRLSATMRESR